MSFRSYFEIELKNKLSKIIKISLKKEHYRINLKCLLKI